MICGVNRRCTWEAISRCPWREAMSSAYADFDVCFSDSAIWGILRGSWSNLATYILMKPKVRTHRLLVSFKSPCCQRIARFFFWPYHMDAHHLTMQAA